MVGRTGSGGQGLDDVARRRAFLIVAPFVVAAVVGLSLLPLGGRPERGSATVGTGTSPSKPTTGARPSSAPVVARSAQDRAAILARVRAFMRPLLRYQQGDLTPAVTRELRRSTTRELADQLLVEPPGRVHRRPGRVRRVELEDGGDRSTAAVLVTVADAPRDYPVSLRVRKGRAGWRVEAVR